MLRNQYTRSKRNKLPVSHRICSTTTTKPWKTTRPRDSSTTRKSAPRISSISRPFTDAFTYIPFWFVFSKYGNASGCTFFNMAPSMVKPLYNRNGKSESTFSALVAKVAKQMVMFRFQFLIIDGAIGWSFALNWLIRRLATITCVCFRVQGIRLSRIIERSERNKPGLRYNLRLIWWAVYSLD